MPTDDRSLAQQRGTLASALVGAIVGLVVAAVAAGCTCDGDGAHSGTSPTTARATNNRSASAAGPTSRASKRRRRPRYRLPHRSAGPARASSPARIARVHAAAKRLTRSLLRANISRREVSSVADIHGSQLYMRRRFADALVWYRTGARIDPSFEPVVYNAARAAALCGKLALARRYLAKLRSLSTPLSRRRLRFAGQDPDLAALRSAGSPQR